MKSIRIYDFGGPDVMQFEDVEIPAPLDDEMLIKVRAASINPVDYKIFEGKFPPVTRKSLPVTLGRDVAGTVEACGRDVPGFKIGDPIYAMLGSGRGGFTEYVAVKVDEASRKPDPLTFAEAAAVPLAALTAWQGLFDHGKLTQGQSVLIHGGGGGVGHFAIQFAKECGATVHTTVAPSDLAFAKQLGASTVVDYQNQRFEDHVQDVDLVLDLIAGETQERSWSVLREGGALVSTLGEPPQDMADRHKVRAVGYVAKPDAEELTAIGDLINAGKVTPVVDRTFAFADAAKAEEAQEHQHIQGKIVLKIAA